MFERVRFFFKFIDNSFFVKFFGLLSVFIAGAWGLVDLLKDIFNVNYTAGNSWLALKAVVSFILAFSALSSLYLVYRYLRPTVEVVKTAVNFNEEFSRFLCDAEVLRVFASNGEAAKRLLLDFHAADHCLTKKLTIQVLLREEDGNPQRHDSHVQQIKRWRNDIDTVMTHLPLTVKTEFGFYHSPVMLCGFVFDRNYAILSWYSRSSESGVYRSPPSAPHMILNSESSDSRKIIGAAADTFDSHFQRGRFNG